MKARTISIILVVTLAALVCLHLDDFAGSNNTAEASLLPERSGRTYSEVVTLTITVDGLTKRLFERKIRECIPWSHEEEGVPTGELFDHVYERLGWKTLEKYDRQQCDAMTDIALDDLVEDGQVRCEHNTQQWIWIITAKGNGEHERKFTPTPPLPPPKGRTCFLPETPALVDGRLVQIRNVTASRTIDSVQEHEGTFVCCDIVLDTGNKISVVDAHCFMTDSGQWIAAQNLTTSIRLKTATGTIGIESITNRSYTGKVYNLKIQDSDQYMVGKDSVIVRDY